MHGSNGLLHLHLHLQLASQCVYPLRNGWTESIDPHIFLSVSFCLFLSVCFFLSVSFCLSLSVCLFLSASFCLSLFYLSLSVCLFLSASFCQSLSVSLFLSVSLWTRIALFAPPLRTSKHRSNAPGIYNNYNPPPRHTTLGVIPYSSSRCVVTWCC